MSPQSGEGWKALTWGVLEHEYRCDNGIISVAPSIVRSRDLAAGIFWIPIPFTSEEKESVNISDPLKIEVVYVPSLSESPCSTSYISIRSSLIAGKLNPVDVKEAKHQKRKDVFMCTYTFLPIDKIGDEFFLDISSKILNCPVPSLLFRRDEGIRFISTESI